MPMKAAQCAIFMQTKYLQKNLVLKMIFIDCYSNKVLKTLRVDLR